jgi:RNA polymerase-binding transcription factor DksA
MKHKLDDGTYKKCDDCGREMTTNICEVHKHDVECYHCHLKADHIVVWDTKEGESAKV